LIHISIMDFRATAKKVRSVLVSLGRRMDMVVIRISGEQLIQMSIEVKGSATGTICIYVKQSFLLVVCEIYN